MIFLAVDLGKARTGLAVCDKAEILASPAGVLPSYHAQELLEQIAQTAARHRAQGLVVGLPRNMDGSEGESAQAARAFAQELETRTGLPVVLRDERLTTVSAHGYLNTTDTRGKKRKAAVDAVAATIILQDYLDWRKNQGLCER